MGLAMFSILIAAATSGAFSIELKHNSAAEQATRKQLQRLLNTYDLSKYTFTRQVIIEQWAVPHSNPVLTLNTRNLDSDDQLLSSFLHEQLHWYLDAHRKETDAAVSDLRALFPHVPVGYPDGAATEQSTYEHLIDCLLELHADREILGKERADAAIQAIGRDHYRWVYSTILTNEQTIDTIVSRHGLH
jgi:hypothetical protein